jgi:hypothetical protein
MRRHFTSHEMTWLATTLGGIVFYVRHDVSFHAKHRPAVVAGLLTEPLAPTEGLRRRGRFGETSGRPAWLGRETGHNTRASFPGRTGQDLRTLPARRNTGLAFSLTAAIQQGYHLL